MVHLVDVSFCGMEDSVVNSVSFSVIEFIFPKTSFCDMDELAPSSFLHHTVIASMRAVSFLWPPTPRLISWRGSFSP